MKRKQTGKKSLMALLKGRMANKVVGNGRSEFKGGFMISPWILLADSKS